MSGSSTSRMTRAGRSRRTRSLGSAAPVATLPFTSRRWKPRAPSCLNTAELLVVRSVSTRSPPLVAADSSGARQEREVALWDIVERQLAPTYAAAETRRHELRLLADG